MDISNPLRLLVVDDSIMFRKALLHPLTASPFIEIVGTAPDGQIALQLCSNPQCMPEVLLLDLHMPHLDAFELLTQLKLLPQPPRCLILTGDDTLQSVLRAFKLGAKGYMLKDNVTEESIISSILAIANGGIYVDEQLFAQMLDIQTLLVATTAHELALSVPERTLLRRIGLGLDNKQIAKQYGITSKTVSNRLGLLYNKIGVSNRVQAAFYALKLGHITLDEAIQINN